jgi:serine/threonine protein kinase
MAPEQMSGKQGDARSDLFSLGVVLYSMITGFRPFQGNSAKTVVFKVMNIEPIPVTSFQSDVSPELDAIVSRAIAKDPDERYATGAALARAIHAFRNSDFLPSETATFIARSAEKDASRATKKSVSGADRYKRYLLPSAIFLIAMAGLIFASQMTRVRNVPLPADLIAALQLHPPRPPAATQMGVISKKPARKPRVHSKLLPAKLEMPPRTTAESVKVQVEIQHHFNGARASIWFDDKLIFDNNLRGADQRHPLLRAIEVDQVTNFQFAPGRHWLQVRVVSPANNYDQVETIEADLPPRSEHVLYVNCDKRKLLVSMQ